MNGNWNYDLGAMHYCTNCGSYYSSNYTHQCYEPVQWLTTTPTFSIEAAKIVLLPGATMPSYGTDDSIGFDLSVSEDAIIPPRRHKLVKTGLIIEPPTGHWLMIAARSGLIKRGLILANGIGVVDPDYCGQTDEIRLSLFNMTDDPVGVEQAERLAQGVFMPITPRFTWKQVELSDMTDKSRGGFGSTGL